jgi:hypothetical protein
MHSSIVATIAPTMAKSPDRCWRPNDAAINTPTAAPAAGNNTATPNDAGSVNGSLSRLANLQPRKMATNVTTMNAVRRLNCMAAL